MQEGSHDVTAPLVAGKQNQKPGWQRITLVVDTMMPSVTITAPAAGAIVANGGSVTITATAGDGTGSGIASVTADVSTLDSTQTDVALMRWEPMVPTVLMSLSAMTIQRSPERIENYHCDRNRCRW